MSLLTNGVIGKQEGISKLVDIKVLGSSSVVTEENFINFIQHGQRNGTYNRVVYPTVIIPSQRSQPLDYRSYLYTHKLNTFSHA